MTNEEKILDMLASMQGEMRSMQSEIQSMQGEMQTMRGEVSAVGRRMDSLETNIAGIRLDIENRIDPSLQALAEGQAAILEKAAPKSRVEALEDKVDFWRPSFAGSPGMWRI